MLTTYPINRFEAIVPAFPSSEKAVKLATYALHGFRNSVENAGRDLREASYNCAICLFDIFRDDDVIGSIYFNEKMCSIATPKHIKDQLAVDVDANIEKMFEGSGVNEDLIKAVRVHAVFLQEMMRAYNDYIAADPHVFDKFDGVDSKEVTVTMIEKYANVDENVLDDAASVMLTDFDKEFGLDSFEDFKVEYIDRLVKHFN